MEDLSQTIPELVALSGLQMDEPAELRDPFLTATSPTKRNTANSVMGVPETEPVPSGLQFAPQHDTNTNAGRKEPKSGRSSATLPRLQFSPQHDHNDNASRTLTTTGRSSAKLKKASKSSGGSRSTVAAAAAAAAAIEVARSAANAAAAIEAAEAAARRWSWVHVRADGEREGSFRGTKAHLSKLLAFRRQTHPDEYTDVSVTERIDGLRILRKEKETVR